MGVSLLTSKCCLRNSVKWVHKVALEGRILFADYYILQLHREWTFRQLLADSLVARSRDRPEQLAVEGAHGTHRKPNLLRSIFLCLHFTAEQKAHFQVKILAIQCTRHSHLFNADRFASRVILQVLHQVLGRELTQDVDIGS